MQVISSLPISPRFNAKLGFYSIPLTIDILSRVSGLPNVNAINVLGAKNTTDSDIQNHFSNLNRLGVSNQVELRDDGEGVRNLVQNCFIYGVEQGWIRQETREFFCCDCGKSQFLNVEENLQSRKRKVHVDGVCQICNTKVQLYEDLVWLLDFSNCNLFGDYNPLILPYYLRKDLVEVVESLQSKSLLLSRMRRSDLMIQHKSQNVSLDVDFSWMLHFKRLQELSFKTIVFPFGKNVVKQAALALMVSKLLNVPLPSTLLALPYITFDFGEGEIKRANEIIRSYSKYGLRLLLSRGVGCKDKDLVIKSSEIFACNQTMQRLQRDSIVFETQMVEVGKFWEMINTQKSLK